jgi:hypothetical protein
MIMSPSLRKLALTAHVTSSVGWLGAAAGFLALAIAAGTSPNAQIIRGAYVAMELTGWYVILPFCFGCLVTGLVMALSTWWGLFRHYWVLVKFLITLISTLILIGFTQTLARLGELAGDQTLPVGELRNLNQSPAVHSGAGLLALLVTTILSVYKPWGIVPFGREPETGVVVDPESKVRISTRGYLVLGLLGLVLVLLLLHLIGGGPRGH